jgi:cytochrome c
MLPHSSWYIMEFMWGVTIATAKMFSTITIKLAMKKTSFFIFTTFLLLAGNVYAESGYLLAKKHMCTACHSLDKKLVGPSWMSVSMKYQGRPDAESYLMGKIRTGGIGTWNNTIRMPPAVGIGEEDIKTLAHYVMKLASE